MKKTALITGASGNLGKAVVEKFIREGYNVAATVSPGKKHDAFPDGVTTFEADLANEAAVTKVIAEMIERYKAIDAALLLAGGFAMGNIHDTDGAALQKMFSLNFNTAYHVARPVFSYMMSQKEGGRLVFVGSRPALKPADGKKMIGYAMSKSLIFQLAELLNAEGASKNVVASVIVPSTIDTPVNRKEMPDADFSKWVKPEAIAEAIYFLCSAKGASLREPVLKIYGGG